MKIMEINFVCFKFQIDFRYNIPIFNLELLMLARFFFIIVITKIKKKSRYFNL